jgi:Helix-turn-helix domain
MARLTKAEAARQLGISRTTLYKLIDQGKISPTPDGLIDTAELGRVVSTLNVHHERPRERTHTLLDGESVDTDTTQSEHHGRPDREQGERSESAHSGRQLTLDTECQLTSTYHDLVDILREQLQAAQERERAYREHIAQLTTMLDQAHQQNQRLLEAPRAAPAPPPAAALPVAPRLGRGGMRQLILEMSADYPDGLTSTELRVFLRADKSLSDTCAGMLRDGLLKRVGRGRYTIPE